MEQSTEINEISKALATAQAEMTNVKVNSENPFFHSNYADLGACLAVARSVLGKNGIAVTQFVEDAVKEKCIRVTTQLSHSSGQWFRASYDMFIEKTDAQGTGKAITYARRYALAAAVGLAQEDDDGESASSHKGEAPRGDFNNGKAPDAGGPAPTPGAAPAAGGNYACARCGDSITEKVREFSLKRYKEPLCMKCQKATPNAG